MLMCTGAGEDPTGTLEHLSAVEAYRHELEERRRTVLHQQRLAEEGRSPEWEYSVHDAQRRRREEWKEVRRDRRAAATERAQAGVHCVERCLVSQRRGQWAAGFQNKIINIPHFQRCLEFLDRIGRMLGDLLVFLVQKSPNEVQKTVNI